MSHSWIFFCYPLNLRSHILMGQPSRVLTLLNSFRLITCSYVTLLCYRYLLLWFLAFCRLWRLSSQSAEAETQSYGACFEGIWDIGKIFEGLPQMSRVPYGRVGRSRYSYLSNWLCPLPAVSYTVIKVGVRHKLCILRFQVAISVCRSGFSNSSPRHYHCGIRSFSSC